VEALLQQARECKRRLDHFLLTNDLPLHWFSAPDHVAVNTASGPDYNRLFKKLEPLFENLTVGRKNGQCFAAGQLREGLEFGRVQRVPWLEILALQTPRSEAEGRGLEHLVFCHPELKNIAKGLVELEMPFRAEASNGCYWLSLDIGGDTELRFAETSLAAVIANDVRTGMARNWLFEGAH